MASPSTFQEDIARHCPPIRWFDRALWVIAVYRLGRRILEVRNASVRRLLLIVYLPCARAVETITRTSLPAFARIGGGLKLASCGLIFIHVDAVIGRNCTLNRGVTIGNTRVDGAPPVVGDDVEFGAYAQVLGDIRIGDRAIIAPMSVVLQDVPAGGFASGIPAKVRLDLQKAGCYDLNIDHIT